MELTEAIEHMRTDLERYAASGKASPKAVAFRQLVLNTVIDGVNNMEEALVKERTLAKERIDALRADLRDRDEQLAELHSETGIEHRWSWLEGRAQRALNWMLSRIDREEGRSISTEQATSDRKALQLLRDELDKGHAHRIDLQVELNLKRAEVEHPTQWALLCGLRMEQFHALTRTELGLLRKANVAVHERRLADGVVDRFGNRTRRSYPNPEAVAMSVLTAVANDAHLRAVLQAKGIVLTEPEKYAEMPRDPLDPGHDRALRTMESTARPAWTWEAQEPSAVMLTTTALSATALDHYRKLKASALATV